MFMTEKQNMAKAKKVKPKKKVASKRNISGRKMREARAEGKKVYESAIPCKHCSGVERYVSTRSCVVCTKAKNQERKAREIESLPCVVEWHLLHSLNANNDVGFYMRGF
tara:strand:+ start:187559 stop:187885 length:327 start_codon:yes stop_codon:yes gene_type:complete